MSTQETPPQEPAEEDATQETQEGDQEDQGTGEEEEGKPS